MVWVVVCCHSFFTLVPGVFYKKADAIAKVKEIGEALAMVDGKPYTIEVVPSDDIDAITYAFNGHDAYKIVEAPLS